MTRSKTRRVWRSIDWKPSGSTNRRAAMLWRRPPKRARGRGSRKQRRVGGSFGKQFGIRPRSPARMQEWSGRDRAIDESARQARRAANRARGEGSRARAPRARAARAQPRGRIERDRWPRLHPDGRTFRATSGGDRARLGEIARRSRRALPKRAGVSRKRKPSPPTPPPSSRIGVVVGSSPSPLSVLKPTRRSKAPRRRLRFGTRRPTIVKTTATGCAASPASSET